MDGITGQRRKAAVQVHRVRRGQRGRRVGTRRLQAERSETGGVVTQRLPELPGETGHRSLAVGAGDDGDRRRLASVEARGEQGQPPAWVAVGDEGDRPCGRRQQRSLRRSEEHTSELQSLMRISYAVFCLKKKQKTKRNKSQLSNSYHI